MKGEELNYWVVNVSKLEEIVKSGGGVIFYRLKQNL